VPFLVPLSCDHFAGSSVKEKSSLPAGALGRFLAGPSGNGNKDIKIPLYVYHERFHESCRERAKMRRTPVDLAEGTKLVVTVHPSALLRIEDDNDKRAAYRDFVADLKAARVTSAKAAAPKR
jgi:hypothetical protein